jgi:hypothetical protein
MKTAAMKTTAMKTTAMKTTETAVRSRESIGVRVRRAAAVLLAGPPTTGACPPRVDPEEFAAALAEDVVDLLAGLADVDVVLACAPDRLRQGTAIRWPGMHVAELPTDGGALEALQLLAGLGYDVGAVVTADVPDLPGLVIAKPFSALSSALVAATPAITGGLAVLACRLPVPDWLAAIDPLDLDSEKTLPAIEEAAPRRRDVRKTPAWHRMRTVSDIRRLDPELEGWETTRALLSAGHRPG